MEHVAYLIQGQYEWLMVNAPKKSLNHSKMLLIIIPQAIRSTGGMRNFLKIMLFVVKKSYQFHGQV